MIPVSMSRKTPSFGQLAAYMGSEKSDSHFDIHHNYFSREREAIVDEFLENSSLLRSRKNGNYLYHEIISITLEDGVDRFHAKQCLREITLKYIQDRCPRNLFYGCLHEDHAKHLHYHLMISANEKMESKRFRLPKADFQKIKEGLEAHTLENYPELKQKVVNTADQKEKNQSRKANAQERRTGKLDKQEAVRVTIFNAMLHTSSFDQFTSNLRKQGFEYYKRGKNHGVTRLHEGKVEKYRLSTIGAAEGFEEYLTALDALEAGQRSEQPKEEKTQDPPRAKKDTQAETKKEADTSSEQAEKEASREPQDAEYASKDAEQAKHSQEQREEAQRASEAQQKAKEHKAEKSAARQEPPQEKKAAARFFDELQERYARKDESFRERALKRLRRKGKPRR